MRGAMSEGRTDASPIRSTPVHSSGRGRSMASFEIDPTADRESPTQRPHETDLLPMSIVRLNKGRTPSSRRRIIPPEARGVQSHAIGSAAGRGRDEE